MSYRDPKIIVDRSAEILAQGANNLGQSMGNMFGSVVANEKKPKSSSCYPKKHASIRSF